MSVRWSRHAWWLGLLAVAACHEPVDCGPCPPPVYVTVATAGLPVGTTVRVCAEAGACSDLRISPDDVSVARTASVYLETLSSAREADGMRVEAVALDAQGQVFARGSTRLGIHPGGDGECACTWTSGQLDLG